MPRRWTSRNTARGLAKIWYLVLGNGVWDAKAVVFRERVEASATPAIAAATAPNAPRYGLQWWLHLDPRDSAKYVWGGSGFDGQLPMTFPTPARTRWRDTR